MSNDAAAVSSFVDFYTKHCTPTAQAISAMVRFCPAKISSQTIINSLNCNVITRDISSIFQSLFILLKDDQAVVNQDLMEILSCLLLHVNYSDKYMEEVVSQSISKQVIAALATKLSQNFMSNFVNNFQFKHETCFNNVQYLYEVLGKPSINISDLYLTTILSSGKMHCKLFLFLVVYTVLIVLYKNLSSSNFNEFVSERFNSILSSDIAFTHLSDCLSRDALNQLLDSKYAMYVAVSLYPEMIKRISSCLFDPWKICSNPLFPDWYNTPLPFIQECEKYAIIELVMCGYDLNQVHLGVSVAMKFAKCWHGKLAQFAHMIDFSIKDNESNNVMHYYSRNNSQLWVDTQDTLKITAAHKALLEQNAAGEVPLFTIMCKQVSIRNATQEMSSFVPNLWTMCITTPQGIRHTLLSTMISKYCSVEDVTIAYTEFGAKLPENSCLFDYTRNAEIIHLFIKDTLVFQNISKRIVFEKWFSSNSNKNNNQHIHNLIVQILQAISELDKEPSWSKLLQDLKAVPSVFREVRKIMAIWQVCSIAERESIWKQATQNIDENGNTWLHCLFSSSLSEEVMHMIKQMQLFGNTSEMASKKNFAQETCFDNTQLQELQTFRNLLSKKRPKREQDCVQYVKKQKK